MSTSTTGPKLARHTVELAAPLAPDVRSLTDPRCVLSDHKRGALVAYCPRTATGAVYFHAQSRWTVTGPIGIDDFIEHLHRAGQANKNSPAIKRWRQALAAVTSELVASQQAALSKH